MNANTALKINDAVDQAIRCGESTDEVKAQFNRALDHALAERARAWAADRRATAAMEEEGLL